LIVRGVESDRGVPRLEELARALGDSLEHPAEVELTHQPWGGADQALDSIG
jgi:hypothetical protein